MLNLRPFGQTGMAVSPLALGTVKFGRTRGLKYPTPFSVPDDRQALDLLALAADLGINLIDTAPAYGRSEERLGHLLAGRRNDWLICTKAGEEFDDVTGLSRHDFSPAHMRASVERSLRLLRTDVLDIVLVHSDGQDREALDRYGALDTLLRLKDEGKIRACGMSSKTVEGGLRSVHDGDCAMVTYNVAENADGAVIDAAHLAGKAIMVKKALASGQLAASGGQGAVDVAFAHVFGRAGVTTIVTGTIDPGHLRANVDACARALARQG